MDSGGYVTTDSAQVQLMRVVRRCYARLCNVDDHSLTVRLACIVEGRPRLSGLPDTNNNRRHVNQTMQDAPVILSPATFTQDACYSLSHICLCRRRVGFPLAHEVGGSALSANGRGQQ